MIDKRHLAEDAPLAQCIEQAVAEADFDRSGFDDEQFRQEAPVLRRLSDEFMLCAYGLNQVRREWEKAGS